MNFSRLASLLAAILLLTPPSGLAQSESVWVKPPSESALKSIPGLYHRTFESEIMKTTIGYNVVVPPSYETKTDRPYPVVYWLHGGGGNENSGLYMEKYWRDLYAADDPIGEVILVFPNGHRSGYMDHHHGKIMIESVIMKELIPRVDKEFRTIAKAEGRAMHGYSMGSSGSLKFVIKYPDQFCCAIAGGGGAIDLEKSTDPFIVNILKRNFNADPELIRQNNTYRYLEKNHETIRKNGIQFLLLCGDADIWMESAVTFQKALRDKNIPCKLTSVPGVAHSARKVYEATGEEAARYQDAVFKGRSHPPNADR